MISQVLPKMLDEFTASANFIGVVADKAGLASQRSAKSEAQLIAEVRANVAVIVRFLEWTIDHAAEGQEPQRGRLSQVLKEAQKAAACEGQSLDEWVCECARIVRAMKGEIAARNDNEGRGNSV